MSKNYSQPGTAVNQATYIVTLDGKRVRIMANFRQIMALLPLICAGRQLKEAVCWLALALVWNVSNRRHIRRLQQTLQEREQKQ